jgi:hypothetical protein
MEAKNGNKKLWVSILRWTARSIGTLLVLSSVILAGLDIIEKHTKQAGFLSNPHEGLMILTIVCFLFALTGLVIALWREGIGGLIALIGMLGVVILIFNNPDFNPSLMLLIFLIPSLLYLLYWWLAKKQMMGIKHFDK